MRQVKIAESSRLPSQDLGGGGAVVARNAEKVSTLKPRKERASCSTDDAMQRKELSSELRYGRECLLPTE